MKPRMNAGWIPAEGKSNSAKSNPIRHHFRAHLSDCGKVMRPIGVAVVEVRDDDSMNCARCQAVKKQRDTK